MPCFNKENNDVACRNVSGLKKCLNVKYRPLNWIHHNCGSYRPSVHDVNMKENVNLKVTAIHASEVHNVLLFLATAVLGRGNHASKESAYIISLRLSCILFL